MKENRIQGRVWILADDSGRLIEDIDTDQIYHNAHLHITEIAEMGRFALGNLAGWEDFSKRCSSGDIIIAGRNFGSGSSRQQAVDCFAALGIGLLIAPVFGAIYFRNAVNSGFPLAKAPDIAEYISGGRIEEGDILEVDLKTGEGQNKSKEAAIELLPMSPVQYEIYKAGSLFAYGKNLNRKR